MIQNIPDSVRARLNSWKTGENVRHTECGDYYILDETKSEADLVSNRDFNSYTIDLYFETKEQGLSIFHIVIPPANIISKIRTIILFPCDITLRILDKRNLAEILSGDKGLFDNFLDVGLSLGIDFEKSLVLRRDSNVIYEFKASLERYTQDLETKIKLEMDYPITFGDIEGTKNLELREQALRKFGYKNYIEEGFKKGKIRGIRYDDDVDVSPFPSAIDHYTIYNHNARQLPHQNIKISRPSYRDKHEKLIYFWKNNGIIVPAFLQVKDSSSEKVYFIRVPPSMSSVQEAKAWTFGLEKKEYDPEIET